IEQTDSTNDEAKRIYASNPGEFVVTAKTQTAGRGRHGRRWISPPGMNLTVSFTVQPTGLCAQNVFLLSEAAVVAVVSTVRRFVPADAPVWAKWPNDVLIFDRKAAGILVENLWLGQKWEYSVVGVGLNVNQTQFDGELDAKAVSLAILHGGKIHDLENVLDALNDCFWNVVERLKAGDWNGIEGDYHAVWGERNKQVRIGENEYGRATRIHRDGRIEILTSAGTRIFGLDELKIRPLVPTS
ncbi:MAG: biotin--[acetyl-CoA-carboxylase] ligase, partial [Bacteroidia bacterium]|nr:biotin--[acetyl-CoA-carboxylase] ligase [Bacteroidia bacterium]MDW8334064.1 biotin--[acetyl-CoA-carboxylase] ligase [Bacteroidia bacterium]